MLFCILFIYSFAFVLLNLWFLLLQHYAYTDTDTVGMLLLLLFFWEMGVMVERSSQTCIIEKFYYQNIITITLTLCCS